jgi:hypothetical protein
MVLSSLLGLWFKAHPRPTTCYYKYAPRRPYVNSSTGWVCHIPRPRYHRRKDNPKCFNVHSTQVPQPDQNDNLLSMVSYVTSGKLLFITGTQHVQQFPESPISSTIITSTFQNFIPFYSELGLNHPPVLPKLYTIREELISGQLCLSAWGRRSRRHMCISFSWAISSRGKVIWKSAGAVPCHNQEGTDKCGQLLHVCTMLKILDILRSSVSRSDIPRVHIQRCLLHHGTHTP